MDPLMTSLYLHIQHVPMVCVCVCVCIPLPPHTPLPPLLLGVPMFVINNGVFGYLSPSPENMKTLDEARQAFVNFKLKTLG